MKKIISKFAIAALACASVFTSCKKADEVTPTAGKPSVSVSFNNADYGVQKDFKVSASVSTSGDSAFINISVNGTTGQEMNRIYISYQKDSEKEGKFTTFPNGTSIPAAGYLGTNYDGSDPEKFNYNNVTNTGTFNIPSGKSKGFKLTIPILLRNLATSKSDVFTIWISKDGKSSNHNDKSKNLAYGLATVTLNYTNEALINNYETSLGNSADTLGSLFATATGINYKRAAANTAAYGSLVDFVYNTPGDRADNKFVFGSFYSSSTTVDADVKSGFGDVDLITNTTKMAEATAGTFDLVVGDASLGTQVDKFITSSTSTYKVMYATAPTDKEFVFVTQSGKKGIVKIVSASGTGVGVSATAGQANLLVKVQR
jgi:hypothetical protein